MSSTNFKIRTKIHKIFKLCTNEFARNHVNHYLMALLTFITFILCVFHDLKIEKITN